MNVRSLTSRSRYGLLAVGIIAGVVLLYALAGAVLLPWLVKRELPAVAAEKWNAQARVDDIAFNPFTLRLRVTGFVLEEKNGRPLLRLREAKARLEWRSLTRRGLVLSELHLLEPAARVEISEKGELNFAALGGTASAPPARVELPALDLGKLTVENGLVDFEDRREGYKNRFERLSLTLSSVSTVRGDKGPYDLVAQMPDGGKLRWKGEVSITPLALSGTLVLEDGALEQLNPYLRRHLDGRIASGRARVELPHRFALDAGKPQIEIKGPTRAGRDLALVARGAGEPLVKLKGGTLTVEHVLLAAKGDADQAEVKGVKLALEDLALAAQGAGDPQIKVKSARLAVADLALVAPVAGDPQIKVQGAALAAQDLALAAQGAGQPFATVAQLAIQGVA